MIDVESIIFDRVATKYSEQYPDGSRYGEMTETPARFPCLTLIETDNATYDFSLDAQMKEHHARLTYEANVYSQLTYGAKQQCQDIMNLVDNEMLSMGFTRLFCNQTKSVDPRIYRMTARYRAVISEDGMIYRR